MIGFSSRVKEEVLGGCKRSARKTENDLDSSQTISYCSLRKIAQLKIAPPGAPTPTLMALIETREKGPIIVLESFWKIPGISLHNISGHPIFEKLCQR